MKLIRKTPIPGTAGRPAWLPRPTAPDAAADLWQMLHDLGAAGYAEREERRYLECRYRAIYGEPPRGIETWLLRMRLIGAAQYEKALSLGKAIGPSTMRNLKAAWGVRALRGDYGEFGPEARAMIPEDPRAEEDAEPCRKRSLEKPETKTSAKKQRGRKRQKLRRIRRVSR